MIDPFGTNPDSPDLCHTTTDPRERNSLITPVGHRTGAVSLVSEVPNSYTIVVTAKVHIQQPAAILKDYRRKALLTQPHEQHKQLLRARPQATPTIRTLPQIPTTHKDITTTIKVEVLKKLLLGYQNKVCLIEGFENGFCLGFVGPRNSMPSSNLKSCRDHPDIVQEKITSEIKASRVIGAFSEHPFHKTKINPIGIVPKKAPGQFSLIHHLSFPSGSSVNDLIDPAWASVKYASFDDAVECLIKLGRYTQMAKTDNDSAFRLILIHPFDHPRLVFKYGSAFHSTVVSLSALRLPVLYLRLPFIS